ncbi:MAG TPA: Lrp/AsnC family transcriptional regulator [Candidatus Methylacidiphilales bacterium]|nr:Lrp/AsnC family transcriptional regulator [Candidatus Methylacidiphilales bacterium]
MPKSSFGVTHGCFSDNFETPPMPATAVSHTDEINARILAISEDRIAGFVRDPMREIARGCGLPVDLVIERLRAMLRAGTIRRVRQTLMATDLAPGALVAWEVPPERLDAAFDFMFRRDPFSGHVVVRSTDTPASGSQYRLWTTLKVPHGFSMTRHADFLLGQVGGNYYRLMPARGIFALGVGHVRRQSMEPGAKSDTHAEMHAVREVKLSELEWRVLMALKRELAEEEIAENLWEARAREADLPLSIFFDVAGSLDERKVIGRFSTFLEHVKPIATGERVTRFNALFHWAVPPGREIEAGREIGRHHILTHCYWREGGPAFNHVNIMAVAHGSDRDLVRAHKAAIDDHLRQIGLPFNYTNVFWGGRSEIKPSEIAPAAYAAWCRSVGIDPEMMRSE